MKQINIESVGRWRRGGGVAVVKVVVSIRRVGTDCRLSPEPNLG